MLLVTVTCPCTLEMDFGQALKLPDRTRTVGAEYYCAEPQMPQDVQHFAAWQGWGVRVMLKSAITGLGHIHGSLGRVEGVGSSL